MAENKGHLIAAVESGSTTAELEITAGDRLLEINGKAVTDVSDYRYQVGAEAITLLVLKPDGEEWECEIENGGEGPGLVSKNGLMNGYRFCSNGCIFYFINQVPGGIQDTPYFRDDDPRLSFLQGNYVMLINMKEADIRHIIRYRLESINISVHTINPLLRVRMLKNRFADEKLRHLDKLYDASIQMNGQTMLCKDYNDGEELKHTLTDLLRYAPLMRSVSVVPVGLTNYRDRLGKLELLGPEGCTNAIDVIEDIQCRAMEKCGIHFVQASDEFYLTVGRPLPEPSRYDGYPRLENGVGMPTLLHEEVGEALSAVVPSDQTETVSTFNGLLAASSLARELKRIGEKLPAKKILFYPLENHFFGEKITVTGLLTGRDILDGLRGKPLGSRLLLPQCVFRGGEEVLLDDMTRANLERELGVHCVIISMGGDDLTDVINDREYRFTGGDSAYELAAGKFHKG